MVTDFHKILWEFTSVSANPPKLGPGPYLQDVDGQKSPLNLLSPPRVKLALKGLRQHYLVPQAELLDRLLAEAQGQVLSGMTAEEQTRFHDAIV